MKCLRLKKIVSLLCCLYLSNCENSTSVLIEDNTTKNKDELNLVLPATPIFPFEIPYCESNALFENPKMITETTSDGYVAKSTDLFFDLIGRLTRWSKRGDYFNYTFEGDRWAPVRKYGQGGTTNQYTFPFYEKNSTGGEYLSSYYRDNFGDTTFTEIEYLVQDSLIIAELTSVRQSDYDELKSTYYFDAKGKCIKKVDHYANRTTHYYNDSTVIEWNNGDRNISHKNDVGWEIVFIDVNSSDTSSYIKYEYPDVDINNNWTTKIKKTIDLETSNEICDTITREITYH